MRKLNICIDIDGTITEPYYWLPIVNAYFQKNVLEEEITQYSIPDVMGISREDYQDFYDHHKFHMHRSPRLRPYVSYYIQALYLEHNIHFVTAREKELEFITVSYLNQYMLPYDSLHVTGSSNKVPQASNLECDVFVEDSLENALLLAEAGFRVLLLNTGYNQCENLPRRVSRVYDWEEISDKIKGLARAKQPVSNYLQVV